MKTFVWKVDQQGLHVAPGVVMKAGCHHKSTSACGGCHARLNYAIKLVGTYLDAGRVEDAKRVLDEMNTARKAEGKTKS